MMRLPRTLLLFVLLLVETLAATFPPLAARPADQAGDLANLARSFENPPPDARIMVRWWWFGPSATHAELEREMRLMKQGGIGGFEVQPVYPLALDDPARGFRNYPYLSDPFLDALRFASSEARELGLRIDLTLGSGWPYGGPSVPVTEAAGKLRFEVVPVKPGAERVPLLYLDTGEKLLAVFLAMGEPRNFVAGTAREVTDIRDGAVWLPALAGPHVLLFFISSRTGQMVKRAALGAEGFVLDHYDGVATEDYLRSVGDRLMRAFPYPPRAIFCDSLEVYGSDWTPDFLEQFRQRRGYDLKPHLPALVANTGENTGAIRHDWGETLTELFDERFVGPVEAWAREHKTLFRAQLYGTPPAILSSYRAIDLPEGERGGQAWKSFTPLRWASSASHLYGRPVTSSETWTWLRSPAFRATPLDLKAEADTHFLAGINQLVGHGWPYSPPESGEPGWRFYAAAALNEHNPWWLVMPDLTRYLQRVSFMLRQGTPANDVAIYLPTDDAWARFAPGRVSVSEAMGALLGPRLIPRVLEAGYGFDFIDDTAIEQFGKVEKAALAINGNRYPVVILPGVERMPVTTLQKLEQFARAGGILVATRHTPSLAPGFIDAQAQTQQIGDLSRQLFEGSWAPAHLVTDEDAELGKMLTRLYPPDVTLSPPAPEIGFVHRRTDFAEIYFLANTANVARSTQATFRVEGMEVDSWDPFTGKVSPATVLGRAHGGTTVTLDLEPYGSRILVFSKRPPSSGASAPVVRDLPAPLGLSTGWKVSFGKTGEIMDHLRSWTDDEATRFFSGEAVYEKTVSVPESFAKPGLTISLDFGQGTLVAPTRRHSEGMQAWLDGPVREAAVVYVNGVRAGSVWHPPYSVDVTGLLHGGANTLRIVVANLAINEMAGSALPDYRLLDSRYGERFTPQDMQHLQPLPSGLVGTIRLVASGT